MRLGPLQSQVAGEDGSWLSSSQGPGWGLLRGSLLFYGALVVKDADHQHGRSVARWVEPACAMPAYVQCWVNGVGPLLPLGRRAVDVGSCPPTTASVFGQVLTLVQVAPFTPGTLQPASQGTIRHSQLRGGGLCTQVGAHRLSWEIKHHWPKVEPGDFKSGFVVKQGRGGPRPMEVDPGHRTRARARSKPFSSPVCSGCSQE